MSRPVTIVVPHRLGRAEARARLERGFREARAKAGMGLVATLQEVWEGDRARVAFSVLNQRVDGVVDVTDDAVRIEVTLPALLSLVVEKAKGLLGRQASLMLDKPR